MFRSKRNRRRVDLAKKTGELKATAQTHAPTVLKVLGLLAASVALVWGAVNGWKWATTTPQLSLGEVVVKGNARANDAELVRLSGLLVGQNLVTLDVAAVEKAIVTHPWIRSVDVRRKFPHRVTITVVEHQPTGVLAMGDLYLVNDEGVPFKRLQVGDDVDLPLISGVDRDDLVDHRDETLARIKKGLAVADAYTHAAASKGHALSEVVVTRDAATVMTTDGEELRLGDGDVELKLERLARVRRELQARSMSASVIRLDNRRRADWVTVELVSGAPEKGSH